MTPANLRVIVISAVRPEPTSGGQLVLHRHLFGLPDITVEVYGSEPTRLTPAAAVRRLIGRLGRSSYAGIAEDFWALWEGRWLDSLLPRNSAHEDRCLVVTVAQGDLFMAALRFARKHRLPLIAFFHDWWPDMPRVHKYFQRRLQSNFQRLCQESTASLCVSEGMKRALGNHPNSRVLYPIPAAAPDSHQNWRRPPSRAKFTVIYSGNLSEYGPMLSEALTVLDGHQSITLDVRGSSPDWPPEFASRMKQSGRWKPLVPRAQLTEWLLEADAYLITMVFDPAMRRRMETSFPSKLVEFAQFGKPLIIWGPEYCSAVRWAQAGKLALCVTDTNPDSLRWELEHLAASWHERQRLSKAAKEAAQTEFNPETVQRQFLATLHASVADSSVPSTDGLRSP